MKQRARNAFMKANQFNFIAAAFVLLMCFSANAHEKKWPERRLREAWPAAQSFTSKQISLSSSQISDLEKDGVKVDSKDRSPTFYFAQSKESAPDKPLGIILFVDTAGANGPMEVSVAMGADGKVAKVALWEHSENPSVGKDEFLSQFQGKDASASFTDYKPIAGASKASAAVATATRDALKISGAVFKKK